MVRRQRCSARGSLQSGVIGFCFAEINPTRRNGRHSLSTFTHEFGHAIHSAITKLDPTAADQIALAYAHQIGGSHLDDSDWIPENEGKKWENCYIWEGLHKGAIQGELQENPTTWLTGLYGYGGTNCHEYFAEAIELWYHGIGPGRKIESYEAFAKRDPLLSEVLEEWLPKIPLARK